VKERDLPALARVSVQQLGYTAGFFTLSAIALLGLAHLCFVNARNAAAGN
jgi:hypothetical protein